MAGVGEMEEEDPPMIWKCEEIFAFDGKMLFGMKFSHNIVC